ncbi:VPLPA-CTERM-specific exosortase XrtD [Rubrimonas cliftonensis]|uniref:VPLPA-CTERM-specific exosortase XrtD n=1 Tax=Rubrimonas cliftonensis TaxID=89524 RepID=UPI0015870A56|nr:VPLPA-CTERM-specific exosortase XrtD [Rubrimonas cliftonensis]
MFWSGLVSLVDAWSVPEYSHGPIIPLISTFLFLREMRAAPPVDRPVTDRWPGVAVLALGLLMGLLGNLVRIPDITTYGFMVWIAGLVLISFGLRRGAIFWPAILHLVFMLPLPQFVYWQVSVGLQAVSSQIGVALIQAIGIPVYLDGNIIDLGLYKLQVAEACSGLRYLFPMLSFSYVFAVLYQGPVWHKIVLLASAAPITVMMNSFRIGMIGVLVNYFGIEHAEGFLHTFEGWIIFVACIVILFLEAMLLQQLTRRPKRLSETLDVEFEGLGVQARRVLDVVPSAALIAAAALTSAAAVGWAAAPEREIVRPDRELLVFFPRVIEEWRGAPRLLEPEIERVLGADDYHSAGYVSEVSGASVDMFVAYYHKQTEGNGIHSPEVCIPAGGWEVSRWRQLEVAVDGAAPFEVNRAMIQKGLNRQLVYFWFEQRGQRLTSDYAVKAITVLDSLTTGRTDGGLVRLITPLEPGEDEALGDARLQQFMQAMLPRLSAFIP